MPLGCDIDPPEQQESRHRVACRVIALVAAQCSYAEWHGCSDLRRCCASPRRLGDEDPRHPHQRHSSEGSGSGSRAASREAEGNESLAGSYSPLTLADIRGDSQHFLGRPKASWFEDGDTVLLGCDCGEWGCWPLTTMVAVTPSLVVWSNFRHGHRTWDLSALGPFHFDRTAYESSLLSLQ